MFAEGVARSSSRVDNQARSPNYALSMCKMRYARIWLMRNGFVLRRQARQRTCYREPWPAIYSPRCCCSGLLSAAVALARHVWLWCCRAALVGHGLLWVSYPLLQKRVARAMPRRASRAPLAPALRASVSSTSGVVPFVMDLYIAIAHGALVVNNRWLVHKRFLPCRSS